MNLAMKAIAKFFILLGCGFLFAVVISLVHVFLTWLFLASIYYLGGMTGLITFLLLISIASAAVLYSLEKR
jgi:hypothetical protein